MGLRVWPEKKNVYIRKGAPERQKGLKSIRKGAPERQKRLKRAKTKEQETRTRGPRGKNVKNSVFGRKLCKNMRGPRLWGSGRGGKKISYIRKGAPERQKRLKRAKTKEQETKQGAPEEKM